MYDFHKTIQDPGNGEFQHMYFLKDRPDLLYLIKRKAHSRTEGKSKAQPLSSSSATTLSSSTTLSASLNSSNANSSHQDSSNTNSSTDLVPHLENTLSTTTTGTGIGTGTGTSSSLFSESNKHRHSRVDHERRLNHHEDLSKRIQELESHQAQLANENNMLRRVITEMKLKQDDISSKTEGVLKLLYHMLVTTGGMNIPKGALSGIPDSRFREFCKYLQIDTSLVKRSAFDDDGNVLTNYSYGTGTSNSTSSSSSIPILHLDTPMIDDFISLEPELESNDYSNLSTVDNSVPLRKIFSFDTVAKSVSLPTDSSLVIRSNSLERLAEVSSEMPSIGRMDPPTVNELPRKSNISNHQSIAFPENQEGTALTRKSAIDTNLFPPTNSINNSNNNNNISEAEAKEGIKSGIASNSSKKRKIGNEPEILPLEQNQTYNNGSLVRQPSIDYTTLSSTNEQDIPMLRLDSMDSAIASLLSFDQDLLKGPQPNETTGCVDSINSYEIPTK
eukprot:CAMPEP_0174822000 /NCGR_PEP_ID=MMETSP1107-20130205/12280_1 /TAXON_ID=36770 /ORGANISM="Paraphysomonas vestita, Strain GFlagA" /LENGTH=501 /DNA_ID=CAMNT_0016039811 /DNA_START=208 /DNA_END=1710 /DNA_ORIENTATION=+